MRTVKNHLKTLLTFALLFSFGTLSFSQLSFENDPLEIAKLSLESPSIDYGIVEQGSDGTRVISFTNTGNAPLIISSVKASCGCTVASYSKEAVAPGGKGEITVKYDTKKLGKFTKSVTITSNTEKITHRFTVKGEVIATSGL